MVETSRLEVATKGDGDTIDITRRVEDAVARSGLKSGIAAIFVVGSTAGLTTIEYEPGAVADLGRAFETIALRDVEYQHHLRWGEEKSKATKYCAAA